VRRIAAREDVLVSASLLHRHVDRSNAPNLIGAHHRGQTRTTPPNHRRACRCLIERHL